MLIVTSIFVPQTFVTGGHATVINVNPHAIVLNA